MRDSGLFHILSISGLHMAIMAGTVFWLVRALLASVPSLALRFPIKKWAAAVALIAAAFYLLLSGAAVPTGRSWIMMSIVLVAVMLDRPAITMRNVALAAFAILIVAPDSLFDPSFEMSFAAVVALVALYEWMSGRERDGLGDVSHVRRNLRKGWVLLLGAGLTTLVASTAIAPFAVYHFHRMTHYGLFANLIAAPLVSLLVMPMALISLIAMPFGLEAWPLKAMGAGIELMVATGIWVASWPGAVSVLPQISGTALVLMVLWRRQACGPTCSSSGTARPWHCAARPAIWSSRPQPPRAIASTIGCWPTATTVAPRAPLTKLCSVAICSAVSAWSRAKRWR
jgi:competence protein ComEC